MKPLYLKSTRSCVNWRVIFGRIHSVSTLQRDLITVPTWEIWSKSPINLIQDAVRLHIYRRLDLNEGRCS